MDSPLPIFGRSAILRLWFVEKSFVHNEIVHLRYGSLQTCGRLCRIINFRIVCVNQRNTYRSAYDKKRLISQMVDRLPFYAEPSSRAPAYARTVLCQDRLVDVIHEYKNPKRMALAPISFHHSRRTRTNFSCRFSTDPLHNRCNSTRNRENRKRNIIINIYCWRST